MHSPAYVHTLTCLSMRSHSLHHAALGVTTGRSPRFSRAASVRHRKVIAYWQHLLGLIVSTPSRLSDR
jgi:hypothetical protein